MIYAFDSDTVTFLLKKDSQAQEYFRQAVDNGEEYIIPAMVYYQVNGGYC